MKIGDPSLDQLRIFLAVAEEGSFGAAARRMGRAVSAISYGIAQLEAQLGAQRTLKQVNTAQSEVKLAQRQIPWNSNNQ